MRLRFTEFGATPDDVVQFVEQGPLLINEQFRVTNHVYEQNMSGPVSVGIHAPAAEYNTAKFSAQVESIQTSMEP